MDTNIAKGINFDYILTLKLNEDQRLELIEIPIQRSMTLIERLYSFFENSFYDVFDMYWLLYQNTGNNDTYPYCLSHKYTDSYIEDVKIPMIDGFAYRQEEDAYKESIYQKFFRKLKFVHRGWAKQAIENQAKILVQEEYDKYNQKAKEKYMKKCLNYIYAYDYHQTLAQVKAEPNIISFSNENHGRFSYEHKVNEDLKVRISTNFCYGSASTFRVIITYKDIELLPYSIWVKYYYAHYAELLHCTRSYQVMRSNWEKCMLFVQEFVNHAIDNPTSFVQEVVRKEVHGMMNVLRTIYEQGKEHLNRIMSIDTKEETEYIGVRCINNATEKDRTYYSVYPHEMYLVYKIGKISGALRFLKNLKKLSSICPEIEECIADILSMNISIYPELTEALPPIKTDINRLERTLKLEEKKLERPKRQYELLDRKLSMILSKCQNEHRLSRKEWFIKNHPAYKTLPEIINAQQDRINKIRRELYSRESFLANLSKFKETIEEYVQLPQAV